MDINAIYSQVKERMSSYKGSWPYDDYFLNESGFLYFKESVETDEDISENLEDEDIVEYIVEQLQANAFLSQIEQTKLEV